MAYILSMTGDSLFKRVSVAEFDVLSPMARARRIVNAVNVTQQGSAKTHYVLDREIGLRFKGLEPPGWDAASKQPKTDSPWRVEAYLYRNKRYRKVLEKSVSELTQPYDKANGYTMLLTGWSMLDLFATAFYAYLDDVDKPVPLSYVDIVTAASTGGDLCSTRSKIGSCFYSPRTGSILWSASFAVRMASEDGTVCSPYSYFRIGFKDVRSKRDQITVVDDQVSLSYRFILKNK